MALRPYERTRYDLKLHPGCTSSPAWKIGGTIARERDPSGASVIGLHYALAGSVQGINWPARAQEPVRTDELWTTTCFELFLKPEGQDSYLEFNFSPSQCWAVYRFTSTREGMTPAMDIEPETNSRIVPNGFIIVEANFALPPEFSDVPLRAGLSAVVERDTGEKSYWALAHPTDKPDFHHPDSFVLDLPPT